MSWNTFILETTASRHWHINRQKVKPRNLISRDQSHEWDEKRSCMLRVTGSSNCELICASEWVWSYLTVGNIQQETANVIALWCVRCPVLMAFPNCFPSWPHPLWISDKSERAGKQRKNKWIKSKLQHSTVVWIVIVNTVHGFGRRWTWNTNL